MPFGAWRFKSSHPHSVPKRERAEPALAGEKAGELSTDQPGRLQRQRPPRTRSPDRLAGVLDPAIPVPSHGRTFSGRRRVGLADVDPRGRVRLDALARLLQDVAIDDVQETGWGTPSHLWFVRRIRIDVHEPFLQDREVELVTWCSGLARNRGRAALVAHRRRGRACRGRQRVDPPEPRPATGQDRGLRALRRSDRWPESVDEARVAGPSARGASQCRGLCVRPTSIRTDI